MHLPSFVVIHLQFTKFIIICLHFAIINIRIYSKMVKVMMNNSNYLDFYLNMNTRRAFSNIHTLEYGIYKSILALADLYIADPEKVCNCIFDVACLWEHISDKFAGGFRLPGTSHQKKMQEYLNTIGNGTAEYIYKHITKFACKIVNYATIGANITKVSKDALDEFNYHARVYANLSSFEEFKHYLGVNSGLTEDYENIPVNDVEFLNFQNTLFNIIRELSEMTPDEIDDFGGYLYCKFFGDETDTDVNSNTDYYYLDDVLSMIINLGPEFYLEILEDLKFDADELPDPEKDLVQSSTVVESNSDFDDFSVDTDFSNSDLDEGVTARFAARNQNHKKRKFFTKSKADLRRTAAQRRRENRMNHAARKRYYRANQTKIKKYQASRNLAIKAGKHFVKLRKKA